LLLLVVLVLLLLLLCYTSLACGREVLGREKKKRENWERGVKRKKVKKRKEEPEEGEKSHHCSAKQEPQKDLLRALGSTLSVLHLPPAFVLCSSSPGGRWGLIFFASSLTKYFFSFHPIPRLL